jgi:hypothetical protein
MAIMSDAKLGVRDFLEMADEFHPEWSLFAVEAKLEEVESTFIKLRKSHKQESNIAIHLQESNRTLLERLKCRDFAYVIPVVQLQSSPWIIVYSAVFHGNLSAIDDAVALSRRLATRAIAIYSADTSGVRGYELFDKGEQYEMAAYAGDTDFDWKSKLRHAPELRFMSEEDEDSEFVSDCDDKVINFNDQQDNNLTQKLIILPNERSQNKLSVKILSPYEPIKETRKSIWRIELEARLKWEEQKETQSNQKPKPYQNDKYDDILIHNESIWRDFVDSIFCDLGIYLPAVYPVTCREETFIEITEKSQGSIEYANLIYP